MPEDRYQSLTNSAVGGLVARRVGLPTPPILERHRPGMPVVSGPVAFGAAAGGRLEQPIRDALRSIGASVLEGEDETADPAALVYDASGIDEPARLRSLYEFFHPRIRGLARNGRIVVLAGDPADPQPAGSAIAQRAIEGFTRSVAKEIGNKGSTANLVRVAAGGESALESTLRFLLSARSAYVDGQVVELEAIEPSDVVEPGDWEQPLAGRVAAVTGAARGIGESIVTTLARDGATVIAVDVPAAGADLTEVANRIGATALQLDITADDAPARLADHIAERHGKLDALIHNAGITRDKTVGRMEPEQWDSVLEVNLVSQLRLNEPLLEGDLIGGGGRIVSVSSVSGIAGNRGQANYATSKAGVIGMVGALAPAMRERGATINAVAPGFIETKMTAAMPFATREAGRRANSLLQGGQPVDVAETIAWLASPASAAINGNVIRVCGQALLGA
ncbi:MAG: 3-oxoacyl-ACP reductase [Solirubrobacterales bacterium]